MKSLCFSLLIVQIVKWSVLQKDFTIATGELSESVCSHVVHEIMDKIYIASEQVRSFQFVTHGNRAQPCTCQLVYLLIPVAHTMKIKRKYIIMKYQDVIDEFYSD